MKEPKATRATTRLVRLSVSCSIAFSAWHVGICLAQGPTTAPLSDSSTSQPVVETVHYAPASASSVVAPAYTLQPAIPSASGEVVGASYPGSTINSGTNQTVPSSWLPQIVNTQSQLNPQSLPSIDRARQVLDDAMSSFENYLTRTPEHQANWLHFLKWNQLREELNKKSPNPEAIAQFERNFRQNFNGLELSPFVRVREALNVFSHALRFSSKPDLSMEILKNRLKLLADAVQTKDVANDLEARREVAQTIHYLDHANQGSSLIQLVRGHFSHPNLRVLVSSDFIQRKFGRPVLEPSPVHENILGTDIHGTGCLRGFVHPTLVNNSSQATLRLTLLGDFTSDNIGYNRGVKIYTTGAAGVCATETISLGEHGLYSLNDTGVDASLTSQIHGIDHRLKIVERIASKKAAQQKPQADAIGEARMEHRIRNQFHQQLVDQLSESNQKIASPSIPAMDRLGVPRPSRTSWSTDQFLSLLWRVQSGVQLATAAPCPNTIANDGITLQVHESAVANLLDPVLSSRIFKSEDSETYRSQLGGLVASPSAKENEEPWSITFAGFNPIELQLDNGVITFLIRITRLERNGQALDQSATIVAPYRPVISQGELQLVREGPVNINFSGREQRGAASAALRGFLKKKLDLVFKEQLLDQPLRLSEKLPPELSGMNLASLTAEDGWLQAHLN